jgi:DNA replication and repair protein RecF
LYLDKLHIQNLRCFVDQKFEFDRHITLIEGSNGSGKTTIVEALYYLCYLRSFRTNITRDLIKFDAPSFFVKANLLSDDNKEELQVGFSPAKRLVRLNDKNVSSFKELIKNYRVVVLTEDDLNIIKGGPEVRRNSLDQHIYLQNPNWFDTIRDYKHTVDSRTALLKNNTFNNAEYKVWTDQLVNKSNLIRSSRLKALAEIELEIKHLLNKYFTEELVVKFEYRKKEWHADLLPKERIMERTLFGAHLDDYRIKLNCKSTRKFASRGQQKLVSILIKIVQVLLLKKNFLGAILFLLDDFMTDFDDHKVSILIEILDDLGVQLVFTSPNIHHEHKKLLINKKAAIISI